MFAPWLPKGKVPAPLDRPGVWLGAVVVDSEGLLGVEKPVNPESFCPAPKIPPAGLFDPPPNRVLPPPPKTELAPAVLVLPNVFAVEDAGVLALDPNSPPAGVDAEVDVWPKRPLEVPLVVGLPKENKGVVFDGSDMIFAEGLAALGLGNLLAVDLR